MTKWATLSLAAAALVPAGLAAQTVTPPIPWQDVPPAQLNVPSAAPVSAPAAGVTWNQSMSAPAMPARPLPVVPMPSPTVRVGPAPVIPPVMMPAPGRGQMFERRDRIGRHGVRFPHVRHVGRGFIVPPFWFGPQFHVQNWGLYGLPAPDRGRWIRYYDDALLVDRDGRVLDGRYGLDWDEYGEPWGYDRGLPEYVGDGDYYPDADDYAYVESQGDEDYAGRYDGGAYDEGYGPYGPPPPPYGGYGYGAYGYGLGGVTITETTVTTTSGGHVTHETSRTTQPGWRHDRYRPAPACMDACPASRPAPIRGERG